MRYSSGHPRTRPSTGGAAGRVILGLAMMMLAAGEDFGIARAQDQAAPAPPPERIDNIYGGFDHQPTEGEVGSLERHDGIAPSSAQDSREDAEVDKLYRELLDTPPPDLSKPQ